MARIVCLFQDYLSELSSLEKRDFLKEADVEVVQTPGSDFVSQESEDFRAGSRLPRRSYRSLVEDLRRLYGSNAPVALSALMFGGPETVPALNLSGDGREVLHGIYEYRNRLQPQVLSWGVDPRNWYLIESRESPVTLQSRIWKNFPCLLFNDGPIECVTNGDPTLELERIEDILQSTGINELWRQGNLGQGASCVVLDTGVSADLVSNGVAASSVGGLSSEDADGHGSAIVGLIRALCPRTQIESICVSQSYSGGQIWNLIAGLTQLYQGRGKIVNISLGVSPSWVGGLGAQGTSFKESMSSIVGSLAAFSNFAVSAAGNDGLPDLRWPAAALDGLAVGSHNAAFARSSFSNFLSAAQNLVLAPGGEIRQLDSRIEGFGRYGYGLTRDVFGTSFSTATASAVSCLLMAYPWFRQMQVSSRISLFRNHCRQNNEGFPILNVVDIGAVWPLIAPSNDFGML